jgi:hypothetical protein
MISESVASGFGARTCSMRMARALASKEVAAPVHGRFEGVFIAVATACEKAKREPYGLSERRSP